MEALVKVYATRLARKHVLASVGESAQRVLETESQLVEMAHSRLREEMLGMPVRPDDEDVARTIRKEASVLVERYAEDETVRARAREAVEALTVDDILPRLH